MSKILKHIDIDLTPASINHAIREIELLKKQLEEQMLELVQSLVSEGIEIAKMQVISMDALWTGYLEQSIQGVFFREEGCGVIFSDVPQAMYVEYGTGIEGVITPYEGDLKGYEPDAMKHGSNGWWYPAPWGWWIPKTGKYAGSPMAWSKGMPSRPFLLNTLRWLEEAAPDRASNMFSQM